MKAGGRRNLKNTRLGKGRQWDFENKWKERFEIEAEKLFS